MSEEAPFTDRQFRDALGLFATGVTIVTAEADNLKIGATVNSFSAVSLSPPLVLFSLARSSLAYAHWQRVKSFGITMLSEAQTELSNKFARPGEQKWAGVSLMRGRSGVPLIRGGLASLECAVYARHDAGDHQIIIGRALELLTQPGRPLVFHGGRYKELRVDDDHSPPPVTDTWLHGW